MSLIDDAMEEFIILNKQSVPDGYGGFVNEWVDGAEFKAAISDMSAQEITVAQQRGSYASYNIVSGKNVNLSYGDIIKRVSNSKYYRITADGEDKHTPETASLDMRVVQAEKLASLPI